jgi:hypothetical protein
MCATDPPYSCCWEGKEEKGKKISQMILNSNKCINSEKQEKKTWGIETIDTPSYRRTVSLSRIMVAEKCHQWTDEPSCHNNPIPWPLPGRHDG